MRNFVDALALPSALATRRVWQVLQLVGSLQDAEDAVQEALLSAWLGLDDLSSRRAGLC